MVTEYLQNSLMAMVVIFTLLFIATHYFCTRFLRHFTVAIASGSMLMALGLFTADCLQPLGMPLFLMTIITLQIAALWLYLGLWLLQHYLQSELPFSRLIDQIHIGTWVAGTAIIASLIEQVEPLLRGSIVLLTIVGGTLWSVYMIIIAHIFSTYVHKKFHLPASGALLLGTVSTQSIVLLLQALFKNHMPVIVYQALITLGFIYYFIGMCLIIRYYSEAKLKHLLASWKTDNVIIYGAAAISGLALINTQAFPDWVVILTWYIALLTFIIVAAIDIIRFILRVNKKGLLKTINVYKASQWARIFTLVTLYAFAREYYYAHYAGAGLAHFVFTYGLYVVTLMLIIELIIAGNQLRGS